MSEDIQGSDLGTNYISEADDARRAELCAAAAMYAHRYGFAVIPVRWMEGDACSCRDGAECPNPGKHPVHSKWPDVATTDPTEAAYWWRPRPDDPNPSEWFPLANIGIVTGRKSGVFVLDVDSYNGGDARLAGYENRHGDLPETRVHHTGGGGRHYFFRHPGFEVRNDARKLLGQGLDLRGERGFVVAPPSLSSKGIYELREPQDIEPVDAPPWLLNLLSQYNREQAGEVLAGRPPESGGSANRKYGEAALRFECEKMRKAVPGTRNNVLNECAFSLGTLGGAGLLDESVAWTALSEAASDAGLNAGEVRATFLSGWNAGVAEPRQVQWNTSRTEWPRRAQTEMGLADRFVDHWGEQVRWVPEWGTWAVYNNGVWVRDEVTTGERYANAMIRALPETEAFSYDEDPDEAPTDGDKEMLSPRTRFLEWVGKQQTRRAVAAAARLAMYLPAVRMSQSTFDADPMLLNVRNGVVNLVTGELLEHSPDHRMTLQAAAHYGPEAEAPQWMEFLRRVQPDPAMRAYLQRIAGYCATGRVDEQAIFFWHGKGANGKSVAQAVLARVLGTYSQTVPVSTLMASSVDDRIPNDVARMAGKRFLVTSETKQGKPLDEQMIKQLTGGDTIAARYMRAEWFEFDVEGKFQLTTNHLPAVSDDAATWRRIRIIPWEVVIPEEERDGTLQQRLLAQESSGILRWIVEGAIAWQQEGLGLPDVARQAHDSYRFDEDPVEQFITACIDRVPENRKDAGRTIASIYAAYEYWCSQEHIKPLPRKAFTPRFGKRFEVYRGGGVSCFPTAQVRPSDGIG